MFKRAFLVIFILLIIGIGAGYLLGPDIVKRKVRSELFTKTQFELDYDKISVSSFNPLKLSISNISIKKTSEIAVVIKSISTEINLLDIITHWSNKSVRFSFIIDDIKSKVFMEAAAVDAESSTPKPVPSNLGKLDFKDFLKTNFAITNLNFLFKITKFDFNIETPTNKVRIYGADTNLKIPDLNKPIEFIFSAYLFSPNSFGPLNNIYIPVRTHSQFEVNHGVLKLLKSDTSIADIKNSLSAQINLSTMDFMTSTSVVIPKMESVDFLKRYQAQLPVTNLSGSISLGAEAQGNMDSLPLTKVKGQLDIKAFAATLKFKSAEHGLSINGPMTLDASSTFTFVNKTPAVTSATWTANLDKVEIAYKDLFSKNASVRLISAGKASYLNDITLDYFNLWFHKMDVSVKGIASYQKSSDLSISVKPFKLQDFKSFLPNNKEHDISGDIEVDAQIKGFLTQPRYLTVNAKKIQASNLKYYLKYKHDDYVLDGPVSLSILASMTVERAQVLNGSISGFSDFTGLAISQKTKTLKSKSDLFKSNWSILAKDGKMSIEKLNLNTFLASFTLTGQPPLALDDSFNITLNLDSMNWKKIKQFLPANEWLNTVSDMNNRGVISVKGKLDPIQLLESQISVNANLDTTLASVSLPFNFHLSKAPAADPAQPEPKLITPEPFFKNAALLRKVTWKQKVFIQKVAFKDSGKFEDITLTANLANNNLRMAGEVKSIFNGRMAFTDVSIPLTEEDPKIQYALSSTNLSFSPLIDFVMPEYKELLSGVANFEVTGVSKMPGTLNFKKDLVAKGKFRIPASEVHTLKLIEEVKQKFAAIKGFGIPAAVPVSNLTASTESEFEIKDSRIQLTGFKAIARNNDEIELNGYATFDLDSKIAGFIRLVNLPAQGEFLAANKNSSGQIEVPIAIEGNLKQPKWSFAGNTIDKMTQNFINYQKNKVKTVADRKIAEAKAQAQAEVDKQKKAAEKQIEDKKKELENEAKKKLGDLFK